MDILQHVVGYLECLVFQVTCHILKSGQISAYVWYWKLQYHFKTCTLKWRLP